MHIASQLCVSIDAATVAGEVKNVDLGGLGEICWIGTGMGENLSHHVCWAAKYPVDQGYHGQGLGCSDDFG